MYSSRLCFSEIPELKRGIRAICSDAVRTRETLDIMQAHVSDLREAAVRFLGSFYSIAAMDGQTAQHLQESILKYSSDDVTTVMCMGHNRGWEEAASLLSGVSVELKTANAALLEAPGSSWQEAFDKAGMGGWKLVGIMKPDMADVEGGVL
jgi:phosphohistidine phosphatase SixA